MPLSRERLDALVSSVDVGVRQHGCDHTTRFARAWLLAQSEPVELSLKALGEEGGLCDCEIVLNVIPEEIFRAAHEEPRRPVEDERE
jgi:hypothetical protein